MFLHKMMPADSDLHSALQEADLVVGINYRGTALIHAMLASKPVVSFLTEKAPMLDRRDWPYDMFDEGVAVTRSPEQFWQTVRRIVADGEFAQSLSFKAVRFAENQLDDRRFPSFVEVLDRELQEGQFH